MELWAGYGMETDVCCRVLRNDVDLHKFEVAQLGSLCPEEAEEAKTLIPRYPSSISILSKNRFDDI